MRLTEALALGALGMLLAFGGGYLKGKHAGESDRLTLGAQVEIANTNLDACAASLDAVRQQAGADIAKADEQAEATKKALEGVVLENLALADQLSNAETRLAAARQVEICAAQLEVELCPSVPLL